MPTTPQLDDHGERILVVDDNAISRKLVLYRVEQLGYAAESASSGAEALRMCAAQKPDLVFLDMMMSEMSGLDVLHTLKKSATYQDIPVVMISGVEEAAAKEQCLTAGASDFLNKPVEAEALAGVITNLIGNAPADDGNGDKMALSNVANSPILEQTYIEQLAKDYGHEAARGFVTQFESHAPELLRTILDSSENFEACHQAASALKGSAQTLGLSRLANACRIIEQSCTGREPFETKAAAQKMQAYLDEALRALNA